MTTLCMTRAAYDALPERNNAWFTSGELSHFGSYQTQIMRVKGHADTVFRLIVYGGAVAAYERCAVEFVDTIDPPRAQSSSIAEPDHVQRLFSKPGVHVREYDLNAHPPLVAAVKDQRFKTIRNALVLVHELTEDDLRTHRAAWRRGLQQLVNKSEPLEVDDSTADHTYWKHELAAFDRVFALLCDEPVQGAKSGPAGLGVAIDSGRSIFAELEAGGLWTHGKRGGRYELLQCANITPAHMDGAKLRQSFIVDMDTVTLDYGTSLVVYLGTVTNTARVLDVHGHELPATGWRVQTETPWTGTRLMILYRELDKHTYWMRDAAEFFDGRFERIDGDVT